MPTFEFTQETMPSSDELRQLLQAAEAGYDPLEELLTLERTLATLEQTHGLTSAEFYERFQAGKTGDATEIMVWAGKYRLYLDLKKAISTSLQMVVTEPIAPTS